MRHFDHVRQNKDFLTSSSSYIQLQDLATNTIFKAFCSGDIACQEENSIKGKIHSGSADCPNEKLENDKSIIPYITLYACTSNHDNQFHIVNCLNNLYDIIL